MTATAGNMTSVLKPIGSATSAKHANAAIAPVRCQPVFPVTDITMPHASVGAMMAIGMLNSDVISRKSSYDTKNPATPPAATTTPHHVAMAPTTSTEPTIPYGCTASPG